MQVYDVRIYPGTESGFDLILRVRGGIMKHGSYSTLQETLEAAKTVEGRKPNQPIYFYDKSFATGMAEALTPAIEAMRKGGKA